MSRNLYEILRGGYCTRWHANADMAHIRETLAEHHARVAQIILALHPAPSLQLIDAALHHDTGEPSVGDVPWPVKRDNPALALMLDAAEGRARHDLGCHVDLAPDDTAWLKMADRLAGWMHVAHTAPSRLSEADWLRDHANLMSMASALGVADRIATLTAPGKGRRARWQVA